MDWCKGFAARHGGRGSPAKNSYNLEYNISTVWPPVAASRDPAWSSPVPGYLSTILAGTRSRDVAFV